jgi:hypothetical protein
MSRKNIITELERNSLGGLTGITKHPAKGTMVHYSDKDSGNVSIAVMENGYNVIIVNDVVQTIMLIDKYGYGNVGCHFSEIGGYSNWKDIEDMDKTHAKSIDSFIETFEGDSDYLETLLDTIERESIRMVANSGYSKFLYGEEKCNAFVKEQTDRKEKFIKSISTKQSA